MTVAADVTVAAAVTVSGAVTMVPHVGRRDERGSLTVPALFAIGVLLLVFVLVAQLVAWEYTRGAVRAAAQEAARAVVPLDASIVQCVDRFEQVRQQVLGGSLGAGVGTPRCAIGPDRVTVEVDVRFESWLPLLSDSTTTVAVIAVREVDPE